MVYLLKACITKNFVKKQKHENQFLVFLKIFLLLNFKVSATDK